MPGNEGFVIQPSRIGLRRIEEKVPKRLRRGPQSVRILLHTGAYELVHLLLRNRHQVFHHSIHDRIANKRVRYIVIRGLNIFRVSLVCNRGGMLRVCSCACAVVFGGGH